MNVFSLDEITQIKNKLGFQSLIIGMYIYIKSRLSCKEVATLHHHVFCSRSEHGLEGGGKKRINIRMELAEWGKKKIQGDAEVACFVQGRVIQPPSPTTVCHFMFLSNMNMYATNAWVITCLWRALSVDATKPNTLGLFNASSTSCLHGHQEPLGTVKWCKWANDYYIGTLSWREPLK